jgi:serine/threonine protein kinase
MAPEQFRDAKNADVRCDVYSLGATLYTLLTGETPFGKVGPLECWLRKQRNELPTPREVNPRVSERVSWAVMRAMSGDPGSRPNSCKEFVEDLTGASLRPSIVPTTAAEPPPADLWYLVYRDELAETHTVKGTTDGIRKALKDGLLGDASNVRASRTKQGQFLVLTDHPEFRDLVIRPAPMPGPAAGTPAGQAMRQTPVPKSPTPTGTGRPDPEAVDYTPTPTDRPTATPYDPTEDYRPAGESTIRPHLSFKAKAEAAAATGREKHRIDWLLWAGVLLVALATSAAAVFLVPRFVHF